MAVATDWADSDWAAAGVILASKLPVTRAVIRIKSRRLADETSAGKGSEENGSVFIGLGEDFGNKTAPTFYVKIYSVM